MEAKQTPGAPIKPVDVALNGRRYRIRYYSNGDVSGVYTCGVRTRERGQPKGAWNLEGERAVPKDGPTYRAALAKATQQPHSPAVPGPSTNPTH